MNNLHDLNSAEWDAIAEAIVSCDIDEERLTTLANGLRKLHKALLSVNNQYGALRMLNAFYAINQSIPEDNNVTSSEARSEHDKTEWAAVTMHNEQRTEIH